MHSDLVFLGYRNTNEKDHQGMTDQILVIKSTVLYVLMQNWPPPKKIVFPEFYKRCHVLTYNLKYKIQPATPPFKKML